MAETNNDKERLRALLIKAVQNEYKVEQEHWVWVEDITDKSGSELSENFGGVLRLVEFKFNIRDPRIRAKKHSYFVKSLPENPLTKDMLESVIYI